MCGFLGELTLERLLDEPEFDELLALSRQRGPDAHRICRHGQWVQLGFNRLSILDLRDQAMQPLVTPSGRYALVFNGEIYNFRQLVHELGIDEDRLRSRSDTEVVAHAIDGLGIEPAIRRLNGMFAIAVVDLLERRGVLARDFAGIKPLFWGRSGRHLVFASQFDQVFRHPVLAATTSVDPAGLRDYIQLGYMVDPNTLFSDVHQVPPGTMVVISPDLSVRLKTFCRWEHPGQHSRHLETDEATQRRFDQVMAQVVSDQLVADVPLATFLSGGIDSPLVTAYAHDARPDVTAYTVSFAGTERDEADHAREYALAMGLVEGSSHLVQPIVAEEADTLVDRHFASFPEPLGDHSSIPTWLITGEARRRFTVMLSGDGGDELFWGYPRFRRFAAHSRYFALPRWIRRTLPAVSSRIGANLPGTESTSHGVAKPTLGDWVLHHHSVTRPAIARHLLPDSDLTEETRSLYRLEGSPGREQVLQWLRWNEFYGHLQRVLTKVDRASMGHGLEVRVPFLDRRILDLAFGLRPQHRGHPELKHVLRVALRRKLPGAAIRSEKQGFGVPIGLWLRGPLRERIEDTLLGTRLFAAEVFDVPAVRTMVAESLNQCGSDDPAGTMSTWTLFALQSWALRYGLV